MKQQKCCGVFTRADRHKKWCDRQIWPDAHFETVGFGRILWPWKLFGERYIEQKAMRQAREDMKTFYGYTDEELDAL